MKHVAFPPTGARRTSQLSRVQSWLSAGDNVAYTRPLPSNVCAVRDCLVDFVAAANGNQPQGFELTLTTTAGKEISARVLAGPTGTKAAILEVCTLFDRGALRGAVVGRQEDVHPVVKIDADVDKISFAEEAGDDVP